MLQTHIPVQPNRCYVRETCLGHWYLESAEDPGTAWSGARWVPHYRGIPTGIVQVCNFDTPEDALEYAKEQELEVMGDEA